MTVLGVDYSGKPPRASAIRAAGYRVACRYLAPLPNPKVLTGPEAHALLAAGVDVVTVWETAAGAALGGASAGSAHGKQARQIADALGAPPPSAIYYAVDFDAQPNQYPAIRAYQRAFGLAIGPHPLGVYGGFDVVTAMVGAGAVFAWQTAAWSEGRRSPAADLYQRAHQVVIDGTVCDVDEATGSWGGWMAATPTAPVPLPIPPALTGPEEDTVLIPVQLPPTRDGSGHWDCDGNPGVVGDPANPPRPLILWNRARGCFVNGNDDTPDPADDGKVRLNPHGLPDGQQVVRIGWRGFGSGNPGPAPLVWVQTTP